jgi:hypothetical protein
MWFQNIMSLENKLLAKDGLYYTCHVFILTPVKVLSIATSRTVTFETQALLLSLPSPPILIPCPGPQLTLCIYTCEHPVCIDTQSSPEEWSKIYNSLAELLIHDAN